MANVVGKSMWEVVLQLHSVQEGYILLETHFTVWVKAPLYVFYTGIDWYLINLHFMP